jgi:voltage-gated potassium channel
MAVLLGAVVVVLVGAELFALAESLPFTTGLYWAVTTATTVGAEQALITGDTDGDVLVSAVLLRKLAPSLPVTALVDSPSVREALRDLGVQQSVSASELVSRTLAALLETPHAGEMIRQLVGDRDALAEVDAEGHAGKTLSAVRNERAGLVLELVRDGEFTLSLATTR